MNWYGSVMEVNDYCLSTPSQRFEVILGSEMSIGEGEWTRAVY